MHGQDAIFTSLESSWVFLLLKLLIGITTAYAPPHRGEMRRGRKKHLNLDGSQGCSRLAPPGGFLEIARVSGTDWAYESPRIKKTVARREGPVAPSRKIDLRFPQSPHWAQGSFPSPNSPRSIPHRRIPARAIPRGFRKFRGLADGYASPREGGVQFRHVYGLRRGIRWRGIPPCNENPPGSTSAFKAFHRTPPR